MTPETVSYQKLLAHVCALQVRDRCLEDVRYIIELSQELVRRVCADQAVEAQNQAHRR
jgi:hypothetical protein